MVLEFFGDTWADYLQGSLTCSLGAIVFGLVTHRVVTWLFPDRNEAVWMQNSAEDGLLSDMVIPARCLRHRSGYFHGRPRITSILNPPTSSSWRPVLVFTNRKSGANQGSAILEECNNLLNPIQIHDLNDGKPLSTLNLCQLLPDTQFVILICGGDGTVNWVLSEIERLQLHRDPYLAILPLGTGNDLSNALGWGTSYDDSQSVENFLAELRFGSPIPLDRWTVRIRPLRRRFLSLANQSKNITMTNYFSIGCDALIALNFHKQRQRKPGFFTVRSINRLFYFGYGAMDVLEQHCKNLEENIELWLDGEKIELPPLEGLLFLNISSWGGGCRVWDNSLSDNSEWTRSDPGDGKIEVIGISSSFHMAQMQVNLAEPIRFGQACDAKVLVKSKVPMQSDGEPWEQDWCQMSINFHKQVTFLSRTFDVSDDSSEILQLETN